MTILIQKMKTKTSSKISEERNFREEPLLENTSSNNHGLTCVTFPTHLSFMCCSADNV